MRCERPGIRGLTCRCVVHRYPPRPARRSTRQAGFVLPTALFLLVVLGGLAAWLAGITQASLQENALEIEGERAYQAAQSGLEAGIYAARVSGSCAGQNIAFTGALSRFTASVSCVAFTADEGGRTVRLYRIESVACNQPVSGTCPNATPSGADYVERVVRSTVEGS